MVAGLAGLVFNDQKFNLKQKPFELFLLEAPDEPILVKKKKKKKLTR